MSLTSDQRGYVDASWRNCWKAVISAQDHLINWIFLVQGGGIAGLLTFAASRGSSCTVVVAFAAFVLGLILIVAYGVAMYYLEAHAYRVFRIDAEAVTSGAIEWPEFIRRQAARPDSYPICEWLAWASGLLGLAGLITTEFAVL